MIKKGQVSFSVNDYRKADQKKVMMFSEKISNDLKEYIPFRIIGRMNGAVAKVVKINDSS